VKQRLPDALDFDENDSTVRHETRKMQDVRKDRHRKNKKIESSKAYIQRKKDLNRSRGKSVRAPCLITDLKDVPNDSKYSGRRRRHK